MRTAIAWGVVVGVLQAASPLAFWWLDPATVYALGLAVLGAAVGIAFRWKVLLPIFPNFNWLLYKPPTKQQQDGYHVLVPKPA